MPLMGTETVLGAQIFSMVQAELASTGQPPDPTSLPNLQAFCNGIAKAIIPHIVSFAQVAPGQLTAGSPASQVTTTPGNLL